jgi:hypothetical protein
LACDGACESVHIELVTAFPRVFLLAVLPQEFVGPKSDKLLAAGKDRRFPFSWWKATLFAPACCLFLEKANRKDAKAQRFAKTIPCRKPKTLLLGEPAIHGIPLRYFASWRLCGNELLFLGCSGLRQRSISAGHAAF